MGHTDQVGGSALSVLIVSRHTLLREGLKSLIADMPFKIVFERESIESAIAQPTGNTALVLIGMRLQLEMLDRLKSLRGAYPHARIVCHTTSVNLPLHVLSNMFGSLIDGCLLSTSPRHALHQSLDLTMMGESVLPFAMIAAAMPDVVAAQDGENTCIEETFSTRELQVLAILRDGKSNKLIARELGLSEATVKVHIKNVLRKLGASNRTEAAIWMTKHGRFADGEQAHPAFESEGLEPNDSVSANEQL